MTDRTPPSFKISIADALAVRRIAKRAYAKWSVDEMSTQMDLTAAHANGCPLDFAKLEKFDDFNLAHDIFGIARHIDRRTGRLSDFFVPRCARPTKRAA